MNDNNKLDALYERVMNVVEESKRLIDAPQVPDMSHINSEVAQLCKEINELPVAARAGYADKFKELFDSLSGLEAELQAKRDEVAALLSGQDEHKKANSAYTKSFHIDKREE